jgi:UDP-N-acetylmuramyl-tripeptide synthetase
MNKVYTLADYQQKLVEMNLVLDCVTDEALLAEPVRFITFDSKEAVKGTLFVCKGTAFKEEYLQEALDQGAFCYVSQRQMGDRPGLIVSDIKKAMAALANMFYQEPWRDFPLVGLTGTKGKSTTVYFLKNIIDRHNASTGGKRVGYISSIDTFDGVDEFESHLTTPEALVLARHFDNVRKSGLYGMVMEVSSQALKYDRTLGVEFDIGCFLNFGADHIGEREHTDVEDYLSSKLKFFRQCATICLNLDTDELPRVLSAIHSSQSCKKLIVYSPSGQTCVGETCADYIAAEIHRAEGSTVFHIRKRCPACGAGVFYEDIGEFRLTLPGLFNVENALAAAVVCLELGFSAEAIRNGLYDAKAAGRMEVFENRERQVAVIVDYAHNRMSFERLYSSTKQEYPGWRVEALFGCPGGKGIQRREELPEVVSNYADFVWITEEDAGEEDVEEISAVLLNQLTLHGCPAKVILDREQAIRTAIASAKPKTVIVMTGKGRELYQKRGREYVPVPSDVQLVEKYLRQPEL